MREGLYFSQVIGPGIGVAPQGSDLLLYLETEPDAL